MKDFETLEHYSRPDKDGKERQYVRASREFLDWYLSYWKKQGFEPVERRGKHVTSWHLERRDY